jgi:hypothetical protein
MSSSSCWLYDMLQTYLPETELGQVESFLYTESWASPSAQHRDWMEKENPPLRFRLDIDVQT